MADPISWALIGTAALGVMGTGVSAIGQSTQMQGQAAAAKANGDAQAAMYMYNAQAAKEASATQQYEQGVKNKRMLGTQVADYSKAGVDATTGSPLEVASDTVSNQQYDLLNMQYQSTLAGWRGQVGANNTIAGGNAQADLLNSGADTTLLTGFGKGAVQAGTFASSYDPSTGKFMRMPNIN